MKHLACGRHTQPDHPDFAAAARTVTRWCTRHRRPGSTLPGKGRRASGESGPVTRQLDDDDNRSSGVVPMLLGMSLPLGVSTRATAEGGWFITLSRMTS